MCNREVPGCINLGHYCFLKENTVRNTDTNFAIQRYLQSCKSGKETGISNLLEALAVQTLLFMKKHFRTYGTEEGGCVMIMIGYRAHPVIVVIALWEAFALKHVSEASGNSRTSEYISVGVQSPTTR